MDPKRAPVRMTRLHTVEIMASVPERPSRRFIYLPNWKHAQPDISPRCRYGCRRRTRGLALSRWVIQRHSPRDHAVSEPRESKFKGTQQISCIVTRSAIPIASSWNTAFEYGLQCTQRCAARDPRQLELKESTTSTRLLKRSRLAIGFRQIGSPSKRRCLCKVFRLLRSARLALVQPLLAQARTCVNVLQMSPGASGMPFCCIFSTQMIINTIKTCCKPIEQHSRKKG